MEEKKLIDKEIVKALECLTMNGESNCCGCKFYTGNGSEECIRNVAIDSISLIKCQKAEIEWLKDENIEQRDIHFKNLCEYKDEIARLEKQVDELKTENKELYKENTTLIAGSILARKDIAKDTAKEILDELDLFFKGTTFRKGYEFKKIDEKLKELKKRNGVEVE